MLPDFLQPMVSREHITSTDANSECLRVQPHRDLEAAQVVLLELLLISLPVAMRCQRVLWSLSWRHSQRCGASRPFSSQPLRWSSSRAPEDSFKQFYWDEENVLYLYAIQRVQLAPNVQEDVKFLD